MLTKEIAQKLIYDIPKLRKVLIALTVISPERQISSLDRKEYNNILKPFSINYGNDLKIICVFGQVQKIILMAPIIQGRNNIPIIIIEGENTTVTEKPKSLIIKLLNDTLTVKDFIPQAFTRKIVYIDSYEDDIKGMIFSEYLPGQWTPNNPMILGENQLIKTTSKKLITNIMNSLYKDFKENSNG